MKLDTTLALACALFALSPFTRAAEKAAPIVLDDPRGDGDGPGRYRMPHGGPFTPGSFDLTRVTLQPDGTEVEIRIELAGRPPVARNTRTSRESWGDVLLLAVDIYIDRDRAPGSGFTETVAGRRVLVDPADAWEQAIVVSALPSRVSAALERAAPDLETHTYVVAPLRVTGRTITARVPEAMFGGTPSPDWGYTVLATSVTLATSVRGAVLGSGAEPNAYTREITYDPGTCENWDEDMEGAPCTFGGCEPCGGHPRVLDAIVGGGDSQEQLRHYGETNWAVLRAVVPSDPGVVRPSGRAAVPKRPAPEPVRLDVPTPCAGGGRFPIQDVQDELLTISVPERTMLDGVELGRIGDLVAADGKRVGRAVVVKRSGSVLMAERVGSAAAAPPVAIDFVCR